MHTIETLEQMQTKAQERLQHLEALRAEYLITVDYLLTQVRADLENIGKAIKALREVQRG